MKFKWIVLFALVGVIGFFLGTNLNKIAPQIQEKIKASRDAKEKARIQKIADSVIPKEGFELPITWGEIGPKLIEIGVIDEAKFASAVTLTQDQKEILTKGKNVNIKIDDQNGQFVVDLLWAAGLAQKSIVYTEGPMGKEEKADVGNFASTGGWNLGKTDAINYLNKYDLVNLTPDQQIKVGEIAKNVYRPCCGNPTWFPDCNHGMAALFAIEMMVSKNMNDDDIYKNILKLNSFWFADSYITTAVYFDSQGIPWDKVDAKKVLGETYSSAQGASLVSKKVGPLPGGVVSAGSCGA